MNAHSLNSGSRTGLTAAKAPKRWQRECMECGKPYTAFSKKSEFCGGPCRLKFNNRRLKRGAEFYDLIMDMSYNRKEARKLNTFTKIGRLAFYFREEDIEQRSGRRSWQPARRILERRPYLDIALSHTRRKAR